VISPQIAGKTAASADSAPPGHTFAPRKEAAATPQERTMTRGTAGRTGRLAIALGLAGISAAAGAADAALALGDGTRQPWISELRVDQQGTDTDEYVEIAGDAGASLAGVWLLAIGDGGSDVGGVVEMAINLSAWSLGTGGFLVARESSFGTTAFGGRTLSVASGATDAVIGSGDSMNLENADNVTYLLVQGFTGAVGNDLDADNDGTLDARPWTSIIDAVAFLRSGSKEPVYADVRVGPVELSGTSGMPPHAWRADSGWQVGSYASWEHDTPGAPAQAAPAPGAITGAAMLLLRPGRRRRTAPRRAA
jgi:hypothetical protein